MKIKLFVFSFFAAVLIVSGCSKPVGSDGVKILPNAGSKISINSENYFIYQWSSKPSLGTVILKIQIYDKNDKQVSAFGVFGEADMPSMRGHHGSGLIEFRQNNKGDYLLPVNIVMPGDWEVLIIVKDKSGYIFKGAVRFDV